MERRDGTLFVHDQLYSRTSLLKEANRVPIEDPLTCDCFVPFKPGLFHKMIQRPVSANASSLKHKNCMSAYLHCDHRQDFMYRLFLLSLLVFRQI